MSVLPPPSHGQSPLPQQQQQLVVPSGPLALLGTAVRTFAEHPLQFFVATVLVVLPFQPLVFWALTASDGENALLNIAAMLTDLFALPALVTAVHCTLVGDLVAGRPARLGRALRAALFCAVPAISVAALYAAALGAGLIVFVLPGIWLWVLLYFGVQVVVLEEANVFEALGRSASLVSGRWWATAGRLLVGFGVPAAVWMLTARIAVGSLGLPQVPTIGLGLAVQCVLTSVTALYGTLLLLALRDGRV